MECIDLRTGYMMLSFRSLREAERAKTLCESRGIDVACALPFQDITEEEAQTYVKHVSHNGEQDLYCNYSNQCSGALCRSAKESLETALKYVESLNGNEGGYMLIYKKEEPLLKTYEAAATVAHA